MSIVIFSGTTEGRELSYALAAQGLPVTVCVATEYGREEQGTAPGMEVLSGRMTAEEMAAVLRGADCCVDATHPYAVEATANIRKAADIAEVPYRRLKREPSKLPASAKLVPSAEAAAAYLAGTEGNILLTTGSKELSAFAALDRDRLFPRILPSAENLQGCMDQGVLRRNIIAMQGPFTKELNLALIRQFDIRFLVTKDGGITGGFPEKAEAADEAGITLIVLQGPNEDGESMEALKAELTNAK